MKKILFHLFAFTGILTAITACNSGTVYNNFTSIPGAEWNKDSLLIFEVPITDTLKMHRFFVNVRNDIEYKYSNLWLFINITQPGDTTVTDTFEVTLADPAGKWLGSGFGGYKTTENLYRGSVFFPKAGTYEIKIQHGMRGKILEGISDVGIKIEQQ